MQSIVNGVKKLVGGDQDDEKQMVCGGCMKADAGMQKWLKHFSLDNYIDALVDAGLDSIRDVPDLEDEEIAELINEAKLPGLKAKKFVRAVKAVKDGKYTFTEEEKVAGDPELRKLQLKRGNLRGVVELKKTMVRLGGGRKLYYVDTDPRRANDGKKVRTVIFIGQTGAGKTTLIQSMTNYLFRVAYDEPFRYELIKESNDKKIAKDKTESQTVDITQYHIHNVPAFADSLTIVDTPGFGDTKGPKQDMIIRGKFKEFFESVRFLDAIYFVVKASDTRMGASQKYLFNMVLDLFGKNVKNNIFVLFTFCDGAQPPALASVKKVVPYSKYFKLNNSGFRLPGKEVDPTHPGFHKMGTDMFKKMFDDLLQVKAVSASACAEVLKERDDITAKLKEVRRCNRVVLNKKKIALSTWEQLKVHESNLKANKNFTVTNKVPDWREVKKDGNFTFCTECNVTCHEYCSYGNDADKKWCCAMESVGGNSEIRKCGVCKGKCPWNKHQNTHTVIEYFEREETETLQDLFARFNVADKGVNSTKELIKASLNEVRKLENEALHNISRMKGSVQRLKQIALNDSPLTDEQYFDQLIMAEEKEGKPGWQGRVQQLQDFKQNAKDLKKYLETGSGDSLLGKDAELEQMKSKVGMK